MLAPRTNFHENVTKSKALGRLLPFFICYTWTSDGSTETAFERESLTLETRGDIHEIRAAQKAGFGNRFN
jgi:hypothetical protein